jgi:hypothetical protein
VVAVAALLAGCAPITRSVPVAQPFQPGTVTASTPAGLRPVEAADLPGTWYRTWGPRVARLEFRADGSYLSDDGCHERHGTWSVHRGRLTRTPVSTRAGSCGVTDNLLHGVAAVGVLGGDLVLFDRAGKRLRELTRD